VCGERGRIAEDHGCDHIMVMQAFGVAGARLQSELMIKLKRSDSDGLGMAWSVGDVDHATIPAFWFSPNQQQCECVCDRADDQSA